MGTCMIGCFGLCGGSLFMSHCTEAFFFFLTVNIPV